MSVLETRWGHSTREMIGFLHECQSAHLSPAKLSVLAAAVERDKAWNADNNGEIKSAAKHYAAAANLVKGHENLIDKIGLNMFLNDTGYEYEKLHQYKLAKKYFAHAVQANPNDANSWTNLAYCQLKMKNMPAAAQAYKRGAELGNPYAQDQLGKFLWYGTIIPQDCAAAIRLFKKSADKGIADAKTNLYWSRRQFRARCQKQTFGSRG